MSILPQTLLIPKKSVKHVKLRTKQLPLSEKALNATTVTELKVPEEAKRSREVTAPVFRNAQPTSPVLPEITIEQYIDSKKENDNLRAFMPSIHQSQANHGVSGDNSTLTVAAQDEAYSYLFQTLAGNCHGLNLVAYPSTATASASGESDVVDGNKADGPRDVRIAAVVYINSGTASRHWEGIELQLERIFTKAAAVTAEKNGKKPAWQFEGVLFVAWAAN